MLFLIYFPRATPATTDPAKPTSEPPSFRLALTVFWLALLHALLTASLSIYITHSLPSHLQSWANFLGIFSTVLAAIQYLPQIWTTYKLKRVLSLSIPMMCIQTPGSFVWAASLAARLGASGWSAWGVYVVTGTLQGTLLVMGIVFEYRYRQQEFEEAEREREADEQTALLRE